MKRFTTIIFAGALFAVMLFLTGLDSAAPARAEGPYGWRNCSENNTFCAEPKLRKSHLGYYVGHDEPALLFYDNTPGSGGSSLYRLTLPTDPPTKPKQDGSGGTWNFQLHPAFWFGMALCDTESYPLFTHQCTPNSDDNIFTSPTPSSPKFLGKHPGAAFLEVQFYAPGWAPWPLGGSCDSKRWCAALTIDELIIRASDATFNNTVCESLVGDEPANLAFLTPNGIPAQPPDAISLALNPPVPDPNKTFFMNSGDQLSVDIHDTPDGLVTIVNDLTLHSSGKMTASIANGFAQIKFDPNGSSCTNLPYAFHPMYATSTEQTNVPWAVHTSNIAFSDEIGHFEYCSNVDEAGGECQDGGDNDTDDAVCFAPSDSLRIKIGGCTDSDVDFDGPPYNPNWPGTFSKVAKDQNLHPGPILFTSPLFEPSPASHSGPSKNFQRVAFETDLPAIESYCPLLDATGCNNPPTGSTFYPFYTTGKYSGVCMWQLGGKHIPGTTNTFGGSSASAFGTTVLFTPFFFAGQVNLFTSDFRTILNSNPCPAPGAS